MAYKISRSPSVERDLSLIFDHLIRSYISLGEQPLEAFDRALRRVNLIRSDMNALARAPHQGSGDDDIRPGLRHVTRNRAVFYFNVDDETKTIRIIAVFFGGQDHRRLMLKRS